MGVLNKGKGGNSKALWWDGGLLLMELRGGGTLVSF